MRMGCNSPRTNASSDVKCFKNAPFYLVHTYCLLSALGLYSTLGSGSISRLHCHARRTTQGTDPRMQDPSADLWKGLFTRIQRCYKMAMLPCILNT